MFLPEYCGHAKLKSLFASILYVSLWILNKYADIVNELAGILNGRTQTLKGCVRILTGHAWLLQSSM